MATIPFLIPDLKAPSNATANRMVLTDQAAHQWYRFVLSFPPHLVRDYLHRFGCNQNSTILDPFAGTGTTLVEAQKLGMASVGVEALPMAHFAASVKLEWDLDSYGLLNYADMIARKTRRRLFQQGLADRGFDTLSPSRELLSLSVPSQSLLLTNSISPLPLHKVLVLLSEIENNNDPRYSRHVRLALAKASVNTVSNLHFGPEVGVRNIKTDVPVIDAWLDEIRLIANDLATLQSPVHAKKGIVHHADSRSYFRKEPAVRNIDAVITSPPYPNEKDYTRTTRLETVLLGFVRNKHEMQTLKRQLVRSNTRSVYKGDDDDAWVQKFPEVQRIAKEIERRRIQLGKTSGFERQYANVTKLYFGGMARHLQQLKCVLRPGAHLAYVVGDQASYLRVMIRTGSILAEIAESLGYQVESIDLFRTRISTVTKEQLREEVLVLRAPK